MLQHDSGVGVQACDARNSMQVGLTSALSVCITLPALRPECSYQICWLMLQHDPGVGVLLMDETGSVGLDLSFVSWVFLMEPLADASLQAQVTARAHRMGASQAVHVETLVMKASTPLPPPPQLPHQAAHW